MNYLKTRRLSPADAHSLYLFGHNVIWLRDYSDGTASYAIYTRKDTMNPPATS